MCVCVCARAREFCICIFILHYIHRRIFPEDISMQASTLFRFYIDTIEDCRGVVDDENVISIHNEGREEGRR